MRYEWASEYRSPILNAMFGEWASQRIFSEPGQFRNFCSLGVFNGDRLIAVVIYNNHDKKAGVIEMSGAACDKRWLNRRTLREMFGRPFRVMGCQMVVMRVAPDNTSLHRILRAYGFSEYEIPRLRGRDQSEMLFTLTDDDWAANGFKSAE